MYAKDGRPSIPPERLLKASLLIALYSVRSERAFCEELEYNLLFRWFLDMDPIEPSFDPTVFTKNRERLLKHEVGQQLFDEVVGRAHSRGLLSDEHFTVDGTLIEAAASLKSFKPTDSDPPATTDDDPGNPSVDFHKEKRSNTTHQSTTDPEVRLFKKGKGKEAKLCFMGHALMENRHGLLPDFQMTEATGTAERDMVPKLLDEAKERRFRPRTLGGDKGYDTRDYVADIRACGVMPHVAQNTSNRRSAIDGRTTRHPGYAVSQRIRKRVEHGFRFLKHDLGWTAVRPLHPEAADRWSWLLARGLWMLWFARPLVADQRLPWERPLPPNRLTPTRVRRACATLFLRLGTPARPVRTRGIPPGRRPGQRPQPHPRYPVVRRHPKRAA
jgi:transposase